MADAALLISRPAKAWLCDDQRHAPFAGLLLRGAAE
jgi:hypothetical protein